MLAPYWSSLKNNEMGIAAKLNSLPKFVISSGLKSADWNNSTVVSENAMEEIKKLKTLPGSEIQIEGSTFLVHSLMAAGLIDELRFLVHPAIMGSGKRFFKEGMHYPSLKLVKTQTLDKGVILLCYEPA